MVNLPFEGDQNIFPGLGVNGNVKVHILQIHAVRPNSWKRSSDGLCSFHLEMLGFQELVESFQIDDKVDPSRLLGNYKDPAEKTWASRQGNKLLGPFLKEGFDLLLENLSLLASQRM